MGELARPGFFVPMMMMPRLTGNANVLEARDSRLMAVKGRLKRGVSLSQARAEVALIGQNLERAYPDTNRNQRMDVRTQLQARVAQSPPDAMLIAMLLTLAAAVLLVACANLAGLLTSRAPARLREIALRLAIGAGRRRLIRQLLTESLLLALAGGILGIGVGYGGIQWFRQIEIPADIAMPPAIQLDLRAMAFSMAAAILSVVLFGLVPAFQTTRADLAEGLKASQATSSGPRRQRGRSLLVTGQVAVSLALVTVALLAYRGFRRELARGPGYRIDHLLMMGFDPSLVHYTPEQSQRFFQRLMDQVRLAPGVRSAAFASAFPMGLENDTVTMVPEGFRLPEGRESVTLVASRVSERYFETLAIPIVRGRDFRTTDDQGAPRVAIVNELLAAHYWPNQDPLGKRFRLNGPEGPWVEIVGVAQNSKYVFIAERPMDFVYLPYRQDPAPRMTLLMHSYGEPPELIGPVRELVRGLDADQPIYDVRTMQQFYQMRAVRMGNVIIGVIGGMGLMGVALAVVGLYALVAFAVARRTREIGIRIAIGAGRGEVLRMVLRQGLVLAAVGTGVGLAFASGVRRLLEVVFPPAGGSNTGVYLAAALGLLGVTLLAACVPAWRASRVDPIRALRYE
jgi:putative ABC transport system permease protein